LDLAIFLNLNCPLTWISFAKFGKSLALRLTGGLQNDLERTQEALERQLQMWSRSIQLCKQCPSKVQLLHNKGTIRITIWNK
jgi:hypothetical protein